MEVFLSHSSNTRSSDNSAKYSVDVSATNHGTPEGLARILDIIRKCFTFSLSSTAVDEYGNPVSGDTKVKNDKLKSLKLKHKQLSIALNAAESSYNNEINLFKRGIKDLENQNEAKIQKLITSENDESKLDTYTENQLKVKRKLGNYVPELRQILLKLFHLHLQKKAQNPLWFPTMQNYM